MGFGHGMSGMVHVELTSGDLTESLQAINRAGIEIFGMRYLGDITGEFSVIRKDLPKLRKLSDHHGDALKVRKRQGYYWLLGRLRRRSVLIMGILMLVFLTMFLPSRILFLEVNGNRSVPSEQIIEKANEYGVIFGTSRRELRSEKLKNALLETIPQLQWAGINTYGCRGVISVKERTEIQKQKDVASVSSIVAASDGVIRQITSIQGNQLCKVGQAVRKGQVLISGYTDCGICIRATQAEGEVYAETERHISVVTPMEYASKGQFHGQEKKYSLLIGKKQINFYKDSGIYGMTCDKMYSVKYMTLPGGFRLPIGIVTQTLGYYSVEVVNSDQAEAEQITSRFSDRYTLDHMIAGQIEKSQRIGNVCNGILRMDTSYICVEMIGRTRLEESLKNYEAN